MRRTSVSADMSGNSVHTPVDTDVSFEAARSISFVTELNRLFTWEKGQQLRSTQFNVRDHHFELSESLMEGAETSLESVKVGTVTQQLAILRNRVIFDYPGDYAQRFDQIDVSGGDDVTRLKPLTDDKKRTATIRMQQETVSGLLIRGTGSGPAFTAGRTSDASRSARPSARVAIA